MEDPDTVQLRIDQASRELEERERAQTAIGPDEAEQHDRRADKAGYLREKLEARARSEREAGKD